jgi:hypothetical protein
MILRLDTGIVSIDLNLAHLQTATVAGKANVKGVTATYTDGSTHVLWDVPFDSAAAATTTSSSYAISINKVSGSGQTALVAMSALGQWGTENAANDAVFDIRRVA